MTWQVKDPADFRQVLDVLGFTWVSYRRREDSFYVYSGKFGDAAVEIWHLPPDGDAGFQRLLVWLLPQREDIPDGVNWWLHTRRGGIPPDLDNGPEVMGWRIVRVKL